MFHEKKLTGKKVAILATDGFEQVEVTVPMKALEVAGARCEVISLRKGKIQGINVDVPGRSVRVDTTLDEANVRDYDALLVPGGLVSPDQLRQSAAARDFVRDFLTLGRPIATICHGPWILASAGIVSGRRMTSWPGIRDDLVNAGAIWLDQEVVREGNVISSRGPQDMVPFVRAMIDHFARVPNPERVPATAQSAPQPIEPPALMLHGARLLPKIMKASQLVLASVAIAAVFIAIRRG